MSKMQSTSGAEFESLFVVNLQPMFITDWFRDCYCINRENSKAKLFFRQIQNLFVFHWFSCCK